MKLSQLTYIFSVILFCGPVLLFLWEKDRRILKKYELILFIMILISLPVAATEYFAMRWRAWFYYPDKTLNIQFGAQLDTYFLGMAIFVMMAALTLVFAANVDKSSRKPHHKAVQARRK
jgi:hypothetical protein